jgi:hypothetical protein
MPFPCLQAEVDALMLFAAENPDWREAALGMAARLQVNIFTGWRQLTFNLKTA